MNGSTTVGAIAERFPMSLNAVSKHLKVLENAGLISRRIDGTQHWLTLRAKPLRQASDWLDRYRVFWDARLEALETMLLEEQAAAKRPAARKRRRS